ncbi:17.9 kDa class II heat shock protein [Vitis vinifera]|uniref:17.9 kDa class II heat shock protein n=1 Tax=Vitis vinifera TaxID=29760 RepID=A0A438K8G5_VITVI|nr:17.9 kDa class II heat shock protein [Vitis vinifera]
MAATPADVKEYPNAYAFIIDMPGLKSGDIKVQVEDDNVLMISGERKREEEKEGAKYVRMERRVGKFMRKFVLPENANTDKISAVCQDGVLTVTVEKLPPPEPKKPKTIELDAADDSDKSVSAPTRTYVHDAKAMAATPADVKEYPNSYTFIVDMPGLKSGDIKVQVEDGQCAGDQREERKREEEKEGVKHMELLTVTVEKLPPPAPKKPRTIEPSNTCLTPPTARTNRSAHLLAPTSATPRLWLLRRRMSKSTRIPTAFIIDMPGLKSGDIKVQVGDDNVLVISGERKREEEREGAKYVRMERRVGKFMRKFALPENANTDKISAVCQNGVLTVTVEKLPPPEPKKPKTIEVKIA